MRTVRGADIAAFLGLPLHGADLVIGRPADLALSEPGDLVWVRGPTDERLALLRERRPALCICDEATAARAEVPVLASPRPRLDFIRVLHEFYAPQRPTGVHPTALIAAGARLGRDVAVGAYARVGPEVTLGDECVIGSGVNLEGEISLGRKCIIKANSALGGQGFGFEYDDDGTPLHFPHIGRIVIGDEVWIGACSTVERAALGRTEIAAGVKVDDLVQVGHNTSIGENTLIMANVVLCGGARIGASCWIAPNSVIKQKVTVGDRVTVGLGAVVLRDVPDGATVAGVPARRIGGESPAGGHPRPHGS